MRGKLLPGMVAGLVLLAGCRQGNPPRYELHEARVEAQVRVAALTPITAPARAAAATPAAVPAVLHPAAPSKDCYALTQKKSHAWRADAVQRRLERVDGMAAVLDPGVVNVELMGDHANLLVLDFPAALPDNASYAARVSTILRGYFNSQEIATEFCDAGFAQVQLFARSVADQSLHPVWTARVTPQGLVYGDQDEDVELAVVGFDR